MRFPRKDDVKVRSLDLLVLLDNILRGAAHPDIGFEDADQTISHILKSLNRYHYVSLNDLESALWSCNMLDEHGLFSHFNGLTFRQYLNSVVKVGKFDKEYNFIRKPGND